MPALARDTATQNSGVPPLATAPARRPPIGEVATAVEKKTAIAGMRAGIMGLAFLRGTVEFEGLDRYRAPIREIKIFSPAQVRVVTKLPDLQQALDRLAFGTQLSVLFAAAEDTSRAETDETINRSTPSVARAAAEIRSQPSRSWAKTQSAPGKARVYHYAGWFLEGQSSQRRPGDAAGNVFRQRAG